VSSELALLKRLQRLSQEAVMPAAAGVAAPHDDGRRGRAAGAVQGSHADALAGLTEREREVLQRIAAGDSNKLIARAFDLSPHTVKRHVANILGKLGVATRGQAAARWREASPH
jgi:LuxR family maltose regulon positive regulatory protein